MNCQASNEHIIKEIALREGFIKVLKASFLPLNAFIKKPPIKNEKVTWKRIPLNANPPQA